MSKNRKRLESVRDKDKSLIKQTEKRWTLIDPSDYYYEHGGFSVSSGIWDESEDEYQEFDTFEELTAYCDDKFDMRNFRQQ